MKAGKKKNRNAAEKITKFPLGPSGMEDLEDTELDALLEEELKREADELEARLNSDPKLIGVGASDDLFAKIVGSLKEQGVWVEDEKALKEKAHSKGLAVMGPDCGTGIIQGVPIAFTNNVAKGSIGIIGASGTGIKQLDPNYTTRGNLENNPNLPTFIMDGFEINVQKLYDFDPNRIESITILKDAAATALYGSRAANGVVVITAVTPKPGKINVSYNMTGSVVFPDLSDYNL